MYICQFIWNIFTYIGTFILLFANVFLIYSIIKYKKEIEKKYSDTDWKPKVSIIIPTYNESVKTLEKTILCVLKSNYPKNKLELIIVDDGSTNDSCDIIKQKYKSQNIKIFKKENGGPASAKNYGIKKSKGELVGTIDSDSFIAPNTIYNMIKIFKSDKSIGAVASSVKIFNPKKWIERFQHFEYEVILYVRRIFMVYESIYVTPGGFSLYKKKILNKLKGFDENSLTEDIEIALRIQSLGYKIRSSLDAYVYTVPPQDILSLIKQRVRWIRGGIRDRIKNRHLFSFEYGDFLYLGMCFDFIILIPICIGIVAPFIMALLNASWINELGFVSLAYLSTSHITGIGIIITILTVSWTLSVINFMEKNSEEGTKVGWDPIGILIFIFAYGYIMVFSWLVAFYKEITFSKKSWETRESIVR
ncbi:glycosyltransferase family 2 protein [Candidatus Micrarchaeota archaeon]|nr:glycosyltransferase family 2 protein [Candidatus Micrarchaeota archaeon]